MNTSVSESRLTANFMHRNYLQYRKTLCFYDLLLENQRLKGQQNGTKVNKIDSSTYHIALPFLVIIAHIAICDLSETLL